MTAGGREEGQFNPILKCYKYLNFGHYFLKRETSLLQFHCKLISLPDMAMLAVWEEHNWLEPSLPPRYWDAKGTLDSIQSTGASQHL